MANPRSVHDQQLATARHAEEALFLWALKLRGYTYAQMRVAIERPVSEGGLGQVMSDATISRRLNERLEERKGLIDQQVDAWRLIELDRIEAVHLAYVGMTLPDNDGAPPSPGRLDLALKGILAASRERRQLMGTNADTKLAVEITTPVNDELELARLLASAREADEAARHAPV